MFYTHLDERTVPVTHDPATTLSAIANRAFMALLGLTKAGTFVGEAEEYAGPLIKAWPGILYFFF
jgi:hypothetical protein